MSSKRKSILSRKKQGIGPIRKSPKPKGNITVITVDKNKNIKQEKELSPCKKINILSIPGWDKKRITSVMKTRRQQMDNTMEVLKK